MSKQSENMDVSSLRREYRDTSLDEENVDASPIEQFKTWFGEAMEAESRDPSGCTLSTANANGRPSARIVLLKGIDDNGFVIYTNYESRKARELAQNPWAALTFWWNELDRQVRIEGAVERVSPEASDAYFARRPRGSQLGAVASPQSRPVANRAVIMDAVKRTEARFDGTSVPRPETWGGFVVRPDAIEFWQGRPNRLHDRIMYRLDDDGIWTVQRLAP